jgi:hypothetical protein
MPGSSDSCAASDSRHEEHDASGIGVCGRRGIATGAIDPTRVLTQTEPLADAIEPYKAFDRRESGWVKVELRPEAEARKAA